jgi:ABC-2 type transport system ATP-binding protein
MVPKTVTRHAQVGPAIEIRDLVKTYRLSAGLLEVLRHPLRKPKQVDALRGLNLEVPRGQITGLLGPNGAGKTTLIKILANLVSPSFGEVRVNGIDAQSQRLALRRCIGYVPSEERSFFWRLSGLENLRFFTVLWEIPPQQAEQRIHEHLERFGLARIASRRFESYSAGQKKMFTIVRALLPQPEILVLDEPTNSLDPPNARLVMNHVRDQLVAEEGRTVLWATHRLEEVHELCDYVALVDEGQIRFAGRAAEFSNLSGADPDQVPALGPLMDVFDKLIADDEGTQ